MSYSRAGIIDSQAVFDLIGRGQVNVSVKVYDDAGLTTPSTLYATNNLSGGTVGNPFTTNSVAMYPVVYATVGDHWVQATIDSVLQSAFKIHVRPDASDPSLLVADHVAVNDPAVWIDVRAKGAVLDGTTNDSVACANALTAGAGSAVFFAFGTAEVTSTLAVPSNTRVFGVGHGSVVHDATGNMILFDLAGTTGVDIDHLRFTGTGNVVTAGRAAVWAGGGTTHSSVTFCFFDGVGTCGIAIDTSSDCVVAYNHIIGTKEHGIYVSASCTEIVVHGNTLVDVGSGSSSSNVAAIKLSGCADCTVTANTIVNPKDEGILAETGTSDCVIIGNTLRTCGQRGVRINDGTAGITVSGNVFENITGVSMRVLGGANHSITDNTFYAPNATALQIDVAANEITVEGNMFRQANGYAIDNSGQHCLVTQNFVASAVANGFIVRAAANANRYLDNVNRASSSRWSDAGTGTIFRDVDDGPAYSVTTLTPTRTYDTATVTLAGLANVVGTLLADLKAAGSGPR